MDLWKFLRSLTRVLTPMATDIAAASGLPGPDAQLQALGILLDRHSKLDQLRERDREILSALWRVYRRTGRPVERDTLIREMEPDLQDCDESTVYRGLKRLRDDYGFVSMIGKTWRPLFDPAEESSEIALADQQPTASVGRQMRFTA